MARKIVWTESSVRCKHQILSYWLQRNRSSVYPKKLDKLFHQAVRLVSKHPMTGRKTTYQNVRSKRVRDYLIFYKFSDKQIDILLIWDARQDPRNRPFAD